MSDRSETKPPADEGRLDRRVRPVGYVQRMGSYQGVPAYGCLLTIEAEGRVKVNAPLYALTDDEVRILNKAKSDAAWRARRLDLCKCDRIEYCHHCYPPEFREGGEWHGA